MMSATATLGLVLLWDVDGGLTQIDKYLYSSEDYIKVINLLVRIHVLLVSKSWLIAWILVFESNQINAFNRLCFLT